MGDGVITACTVILGVCEGRYDGGVADEPIQEAKARRKVCLEAGNLVFIMAKEIEKSVRCQIRVLNPSHLPIIYVMDNKTDKGVVRSPKAAK
jgi:hypothetical protein